MAMKGEQSFSLKDNLFNADTVGVLGRHIERAYPDFNRPGFLNAVLGAFWTKMRSGITTGCGAKSADRLEVVVVGDT